MAKKFISKEMNNGLCIQDEHSSGAGHLVDGRQWFSYVGHNEERMASLKNRHKIEYDIPARNLIWERLCHGYDKLSKCSFNIRKSTLNCC